MPPRTKGARRTQALHYTARSLALVMAILVTGHPAQDKSPESRCRTGRADWDRMKVLAVWDNGQWCRPDEDTTPPRFVSGVDLVTVCQRRGPVSPARLPLGRRIWYN